jgi:polar amino acid transport system substrate-binding protein
MKANRFDVLISLADFKSRQNAVTFIDYLNMGETVVAPADKNTTLTSLDNMCGLRVAFAKGSGVQPEGERISANCVKQGKQPMIPNIYPDDNLVFLSLTTGASDVAWVDSPEGYYNTKKFPTKYKVIFFTYKAPYGIGFGVDEKSKQLVVAMQKALLKLQADGTYEKLLGKWGLQAKDALPTFPINGATSH